MGFVKQWTGVNRYMLTKPGYFFDVYDERHGIGYPLVFMLTSLLAVMVPFGVVVTLVNITEPTQVLAGIAVMVFLGVVFWLASVVEVLIAHGILVLFGARGVATSLEAYAFPALIRYGLWWFPLVNLGIACYGLILQGKALSSFHDLSPIKVALAVIVAALLSGPAFVVVVAVVAAFVLDLGGTQPMA
ncbi:hypothetical protein [Halovivax cerinus]|uniref:Yip1 domain-containing protein n=1 Tax=Halovivax cerinus TaxID=1487865 RepID=A0ABD5NJD6_9EURY|nr:hypothetical protein [Halovivax cerinus]